MAVNVMETIMKIFICKLNCRNFAMIFNKPKYSQFHIQVFHQNIKNIPIFINVIIIYLNINREFNILM